MWKTMARIARIIIPKQVYLVSHASPRRGGIFPGDDDRRLYLEYLAHYAKEYRMDVLAYVLLQDRVLLLVVGHRDNSLAQAIGRTHMRYARNMNGKRGSAGTLWADRFASTLLQDTMVADAVKFIEQSPWRARLEKAPGPYRWSSAAARTAGRKDPLLAPLPVTIPHLRKWMAEPLEAAVGEQFRRNLSTGRPTGTVEYLRKLEKRLGRKLLPERRGPKPKAAGVAAAKPAPAPPKRKPAAR